MPSPVSDDPRSSELDLLWSTETGGKTLDAIKALSSLLTKIGADGVVTDDEVRELQAWKVKHRSVVGREALRPFRDWLDKVLADGEVDADERVDLLAWCEWAKAWSEKRKAPMPAPRPVPAPTPSYTPPAYQNWRADPMTDRQESFLLDLGASRSRIRGMTKGQASDLIDQLLEKRGDAPVVRQHVSRQAKPSGGGFSILWLVVIVVVIIVIAVAQHR